MICHRRILCCVQACASHLLDVAQHHACSFAACMYVPFVISTRVVLAAHVLYRPDCCTCTRVPSMCPLVSSHPCRAAAHNHRLCHPDGSVTGHLPRSYSMSLHGLHGISDWLEASLPICQPASKPASQSASKPASRPASKPASQPANQPISQSASQPAGARRTPVRL